MDSEHALAIINALASGVDPFTGEVFPPESALQSPEIIRALFFAARAIEQNRDKEKDKDKDNNKPKSKNANLPVNAGTSWSKTEDHKLVVAFESGSSEKELALVHQRTLGAIRSRLMKLGKLKPYANG